MQSTKFSKNCVKRQHSCSKVLSILHKIQCSNNSGNGDNDDDDDDDGDDDEDRFGSSIVGLIRCCYLFQLVGWLCSVPMYDNFFDG